MKIRNFSDVKTILFNNLTVRQTIFKNTFWMTLAHGVDGLLSLVLLIYVARIFGATEYGKFTFGLAFVALFTVFFGLGINQIITREFAKDKRREKEFSAILSLKIILGLITAILIWISSFFITGDLAIQRVIRILAGFALLENFCTTIYAFFQARQKMEYHALAKILQAILMVGLGLFVVFNLPSIENLAYTYLFSVLAVLIVTLAILHFKIQPISLNLNEQIWKNFLRLSWPLALVVVFSQVYNQIDSVMLGYWGQITQTGWYNAAYRVAGVALIPMALITTNFFPVLSKTFQGSKERFQRIWDRQMELMIILAFPLMIGGIALAPRIIIFFYGQDFTPSILALQILLIMIGILFLYSSFQKLLIVANQQKNLFWVVLLGAVINIVLNLLLIPKFSLYGAAAATVFTHLFIFFLLVKFALKATAIKPFNSTILLSFVGAVIGSAVMYFVIFLPFVYSFNIIIIVLIGAGIYFISFLGYKKLINQLLYKKGQMSF